MYVHIFQLEMKKYTKDKKGPDMKKLIRIFTLLIILNIVFILFPEKISAQQGYMNYQGFYDQLSPYGQWVENPNFGYVWIPYEGSGFTPYLSNGYMAAFYGMLAVIPLSYCHIILLSSEDAIKCLAV